MESVEKEEKMFIGCLCPGHVKGQKDNIHGHLKF